MELRESSGVISNITRYPNFMKHLSQKQCSGPCKQTKLTTFFYKDRSRGDGYGALCKSCEKTRQRQFGAEVECGLCINVYPVSKLGLTYRRSTTLCECCRRELRRAQNQLRTGKSNPNWNGGVAPNTLAFYRSSAWRTLRKQAILRDQFQCVDCGSVKDLEVNHIEPRCLNPELRLELDNLETLCKICHAVKTAWLKTLLDNTCQFNIEDNVAL